MDIRVNERTVSVDDGTTINGLRSERKPDADVVIVNGAPAVRDRPLREGDRVVLIARGEAPSSSELEALMAARHTPGVHERVKAATVGVAGLGGLGSNVSVALARVGVGSLVLADCDVVEPSNLNRQEYFVEQIGMLKTDALSETLHRINPYVAIRRHNVVLTGDNVASMFEGVDVLVEAVDRAESKATIAEAFHSAYPHTPLVMASGMAGHASANLIRTRKLGRARYVVGDLLQEAREGQGLMAPRVAVAAAHQAHAVLRLLLGESVGETGTSS